MAKFSVVDESNIFAEEESKRPLVETVQKKIKKDQPLDFIDKVVMQKLGKESILWE